MQILKFKCCEKPKGKQTYETPEVKWVKDNFSDFEMDVLELVNYHRREKGLPMLLLSLRLSNIARPHTLYMIEQGKASHKNFPIRNLQATKYCKATWLGECVSYGFGTPAGFLGQLPYRNKWGKMIRSGWLGSDEHRAIIESPKATSFALVIGFNNKGRSFATLLFIDKPETNLKFLHETATKGQS